MTDQPNKLQALVDDRWTYILYLNYTKAGDLYTIQWIPLSLDEEGRCREGIHKNDASSMLALELEVLIDAKSLGDWGVTSEKNLEGLIFKNNQSEYDRAVQDLKNIKGKSVGLPESVDLQEISYHLENVVGRYECWFQEMTPTEELESTEPENDEYRITKSGDGWIIKFGDEDEFALRDLRGMKYLVELILKPNQSIHVNELVEYSDSTIDISQAIGEGLSIRSGEVEQPLIDSKARKETEKKIAILYRDKTEAEEEDTPESILIANEIQEEIENLEKYLKGSSSNRPPISKSLKRKSDAVRKAINECIDQINKHSPKLAEYLNNHIKTGSWLAYQPPDQGPHWWIRL